MGPAEVQRHGFYFDRLAEGLIAFAKAQFDLQSMEGEGALRTTRRVNLESQARQGEPDAIAELANIPRLPAGAVHLWKCFQDLHSTRTSNGMSASRLTRAEIRQWESDEHQSLELWERRAVMGVDAEWLSAVLASPER